MVITPGSPGERGTGTCRESVVGMLWLSLLLWSDDVCVSVLLLWRTSQFDLKFPFLLSSVSIEWLRLTSVCISDVQEQYRHDDAGVNQRGMRNHWQGLRINEPPVEKRSGNRDVFFLSRAVQFIYYAPAVIFLARDMLALQTNPAKARVRRWTRPRAPPHPTTRCDMHWARAGGTIPQNVMHAQMERRNLEEKLYNRQLSMSLVTATELS
ncbi:hypothetical protein EDB92DRAFT_541264 [Lactarius akahatsu]|uniref:Uncharacterized protein n=1 Tax=Lactarius akahatsu TaxID=416441 RepID=A0AAD4LIR8_9AGAM|nr:hypothetical protein EDB92DRAFT_541264 [Lactarius akahatsu]